LTFDDNSRQRWTVILVFSVPAQERLQVCGGDPENTIEPVGYKLSGVDPAANRPGRDTQTLRDVGDGEKTYVCAIAPSAEVNLRFHGSVMSHVNGPRSVQPLLSRTPADSEPA
jgi:hypothetical protein